jgi:hypothetical protein
MVVDTGCAPIGVVPVLYPPAPPPPAPYPLFALPPPPPPATTTYSTVAEVQFGAVAKVPELVNV